MGGNGRLVTLKPRKPQEPEGEAEEASTSSSSEADEDHSASSSGSGSLPPCSPISIGSSAKAKRGVGNVEDEEDQEQDEEEPEEESEEDEQVPSGSDQASSNEPTTSTRRVCLSAAGVPSVARVVNRARGGRARQVQLRPRSKVTKSTTSTAEAGGDSGAAGGKKFRGRNVHLAPATATAAAVTSAEASACGAKVTRKRDVRLSPAVPVTAASTSSAEADVGGGEKLLKRAAADKPTGRRSAASVGTAASAGSTSGASSTSVKTHALKASASRTNTESATSKESATTGAREEKDEPKKERRGRSAVETKAATSGDSAGSNKVAASAEEATPPPKKKRRTKASVEMDGGAARAAAAAARTPSASTEADKAAWHHGAHSQAVTTHGASTSSSGQSEDLSEAEQRELRSAVLDQLRRTVGGEEKDAEVLAEFISVLVDQRKTRAEMALELEFLADEAEPFAAWVEDRKEKIIARRRGGKRSAGPRAQLTPKLHTAAVDDDVVIVESTGQPFQHDVPGADRWKVVTEKLVLKPNTDTSGGATLGDGTPSPSERKMELLAEMTKKLQEILGRLSAKGLDDESRERYQLMAQTIQAQLTAFSRPAKP